MTQDRLLGQHLLSLQQFTGLETLFAEFSSSQFKALSSLQKRERVNRALYEQIETTPTPCFLLGAVIGFMERIAQEGVLETYTFGQFELWLNQLSGLSAEQNALARAKIVGKNIPRSAYQGLFPVGTGKTYPGSHVVTAHSSPDLDTTVASFWGWVDAFGARVAEGLHVWNVPGGPPVGQVEIDLLFNTLFGASCFDLIAKQRSALSLSAMDLVTQKGFVRESADTSLLEINHEGGDTAVVLVTPEGHYRGDWRSLDVEGVRQVLSLFNHSLRWFGHWVQSELLVLFAEQEIKPVALSQLIQRLKERSVGTLAPLSQSTSKQRHWVHLYLVKVLGVVNGLESTMQELSVGIKKVLHVDIQPFFSLLDSWTHQGVSVWATRHDLCMQLKDLWQCLDQAIEQIRSHADQLGIALRVKEEVFGHKPHYVDHRADVEEIRGKIGQSPYLSVVMADPEGCLAPLGVVHAATLGRSVLGTVTLRDFCNREETKIPSYLEVISVIDHHKTHLQTTSAPLVLIADAQSSNVLCAEAAFAINDRFGSRGMSPAAIAAQTAQLLQECTDSSNQRCLSRLLQRQAGSVQREMHFIDPVREAVEYLHFLYGILDDTDLLSKVSVRDLECVVELVNRLGSLMVGQEVEWLALDDIVRNEAFLKVASERILQHPQMYSLYKKVYQAKEQGVAKAITEAATGSCALLFADTKEQNGCARVGQAKLFPCNYPLFSQNAQLLTQHWSQSAQSFYEDHKEIDLHMQMISTVCGAEEVFAAKEEGHAHQDELWLWIPFTEGGVEHLKEFLSQFGSAPQLRQHTFHAHLYGRHAQDYKQLLAESFPLFGASTTHSQENFSCIVLKYKAGLLNSRKAMISPYLPHSVR